MPSTGPPPRDYLIEEYTRTVCPACFATRPRRSDEGGVFVDGLLVSHSGSVWLRRFCPVHGETESLYEESVDLWRARAGWQAPTLQVTPDRADNHRGFPAGYRDGLPASHGQHTCILVLNLTARCNLHCPACYAAAGGPQGEREPTLDELLHTVRTVLGREQGRLGVVMLSGGEPTLRDDLPALLDRLVELPVTRVMLNTNGLRLAQDDALLDQLRRVRQKVEVYLQLDGLKPAADLALRGEDRIAAKLTALRRLDEAGVFCTLVTTVARGHNEDQLGSLLRLGLNTPHCAGLALQPLFGSGRSVPFDPRDRTTPTAVQRLLGEQSAGLLGPADLIPLPCSHRDCCDLSYLLRTADDSWHSLPRLVGREELRRWVHLLSNTITFEDLRDPAIEAVRSGALQRVLSQQFRVVTPEHTRDVATLCDCVPGLTRRLGGLWAKVNGREGALERLAERTFRITVKMFMDSHRFHEARVRQCCVHAGTFETDPRRHSFCWRWLFADATDFPEGVVGCRAEAPA